MTQMKLPDNTMFKATANDYIYPFESITTVNGQNLYLPLEVDTEYTHAKYDLNHPNLEKISINITVQCRSIVHKEGLIYTHPDSTDIARHKIFNTGFIAFNYLEDYGYKTELQRLPSWDTKLNLPWLQFDTYSFFALAELMRMFQGFCLEDIKFLLLNPGTSGIEQGRRLRTYTKSGKQLFNWVELPWVLTINDHDYRVRLAIYDTCAVHGIANYSSFCKNSGVELLYKDNFTSKEKSEMDIMYTSRPDDFDNYALGDLHNHDALMGNFTNFKRVYQALELEGYENHPRFTIGATVAKLFEATIKKLFNSAPNSKDAINAFCKYASSDWLKRKSTTTACFNAKVDGGRCRNNRPLETTFTGAICDIDISGCYGEGLRVQTYPLGIPVVIDYPVDSDINDYDTLRKFLKKYKSQFLPGLWQARVSNIPSYKLQNSQDYLASWFPPKDISKMPTDTDYIGTDEFWTIDNVGEIKILTNEVHHAIITHDFIQWLENVANEKQRNELLDNLIVETAMYYPASQRVASVDDLINAHKNHTGKNTTTIKHNKNNVKKISVEQECHAWYGVNLGDLLVNKLLIERKKYPKKTPFNDLYKLCINTVYGDMVSPFFTIGNVVVGNNITARARALAWCMEKGLHGWQTITDGCTFDLNRVLLPREDYRITGALVTNLYANDRCDNYCFKSLYSSNELCVTLNSVNIEIVDIEGLQTLKFNLLDKSYTLTHEESMTWVNSVAMKHLQRLFPNLDILHQPNKDVYGTERIGQFYFEAKGFYKQATFHGSANYSLSIDGVHKFAMRSYSKRDVDTVLNCDDLQVIKNNGKPSDNFLLALHTPSAVGRGNVYLRERILKVGDFRKNQRKWENSKVYPGVTITSPSILREFSLSQFTFQNHEQYKSWSQEYNKLLRHYGQSYEMFFTNKDGSLNYRRMIKTVDGAIRGGKMSLLEDVPRHIIKSEYVKRYHQSFSTLQKVAAKLAELYNCDCGNESEFIDTVEFFVSDDFTMQ